MATGFGSIPMGELENWNYSNQSEFYHGSCSKIHGSVGEFFPPKRSKDESIFLFSPEMCRSVELEYTEETEYNGLKAYKYVGKEKMLDNGKYVYCSYFKSFLVLTCINLLNNNNIHVNQ